MLTLLVSVSELFYWCTVLHTEVCMVSLLVDTDELV